jgi:hypothetical protein
LSSTRHRYVITALTAIVSLVSCLPVVGQDHTAHEHMNMGTASGWRFMQDGIPLGEATGLTLAAAVAGEPALGPVAFMHRASSADNPVAPLGHHTFDSTHVSFGVVTASVDHGHWEIEGSVFNGREPDDQRWDLDFGKLDSVSGRVWFRPSENWQFQVSTGHLTAPEQLEPGNLERSTISVDWTRRAGDDFTSVGAGYGRNDTAEGSRNATFLEAARRAGRQSVYSRVELLQVETALLVTGGVPLGSQAALRDPVLAVTVGGVRDVISVSRMEGGVGADVGFYAMPEVLRDVYGAHPVSFHIYFRLSPRGATVARMWNVHMSQPMR